MKLPEESAKFTLSGSCHVQRLHLPLETEPKLPRPPGCPAAQGTLEGTEETVCTYFLATCKTCLALSQA